MFYQHGYFSTIFIIAILRVTSSNAGTIDRDAQQSTCGALKFRCKNGGCISSQLLCDGSKDCSDGSDETREECARPEIVCPEYAFRCDYGACVDGDAACNGVDDCADRSDELLPRCTNRVGSTMDAGPKCASLNEFRCNNGQCIQSAATCDGTADCSDSSDETIALCSRIDCPAFTFRCNYGACIDANLKCNGVNNCVDGSDEDPNLCPLLPTPVNTERPGGTPSTIPVGGDIPPCYIPEQPENGHWLLYKSQCQNDRHCDPPGTRLNPGTRLIYMCNQGYRVNGSENVYCGPRGEWSDKPSCSEIRCKPLTTVSTDADCTYKNDWTSCAVPAPIDTEARVSCRNSYRPTSYSVISKERDKVRCNAQGQWQPEPIKCSAECGKISTIGKALIVNGSLAKTADFPWHATLYRSETPSAPKTFICGATIIHRDLLITAAHCVYDERTRKVEEASKYAVATGNLFQDYDSPLHNKLYVKKSQVKEVYVPCNYLGFEGNFDRDIAILRIKDPFTFSAILMPICLDVGNAYEQAITEPGNLGRVAGFGTTASGEASQILQTLEVPVVTLKECKTATDDPENERFITIDKFCAGFKNGSSVCDGDSGSGLVFKSEGLWTLRGIVSVGLGATRVGNVRRCNSYAYSVYTRISSHIEWIQDVMLKLELYNTISQCPPESRRLFG